MDCSKYLELMSAALDGELTADERRELDSHLAVCPECAELFHTLSANADAMRELDCEVPADLKQRIMDNLPEQEKPVEKIKPVRWTPKTGKVIHWKRWAPVAAAACLALVIALVPKSGMSNNAAPGAQAPSAAEPRAPGAAPIPNTEADDYIVTNSEASTFPSYGELEMGGLVDPAEPAAQEPQQDGSMAPETTAPIGTEENGTTISLSFEKQRSIRLRTYTMPEEGAVIIGSVESLNNYLDQFKSYLGEDLRDVSEDLYMLQNHYGYDQFFLGERLLLIRVDAPSGGDRLRIADGGLFRDSVILEQTADGLTFDMGYWLIVAEVSANFFEDGDTLKVSIDKAYDRYCYTDNIWTHRVGLSGSTSSETTVIRNMDELNAYLENNIYYTDPVTGELNRNPAPEDLISIYGAPVSETSFRDGSALLAFTMSAPVASPRYEVLTVSSEAVTVRQDHYFYGDTCPSTWLILVQAYDKFDSDHPPRLVVEDGYP